MASGQSGAAGSLSDFWKEKYLKEFIPNGGGKVKFVTGRKGSGKSWFLRRMGRIAEEENFQVVSFSAQNVWLHDFKEIYAEIFRQSDILTCLERCGEQIVINLGYDLECIPAGGSFMDALAQQGQNDALTKREIRKQLKDFFLDDPLLDNNFALACSLLTGGLLGYPALESHNRELLLRWLEGDKTVKLPALRALGMSPVRVTKYNARHMLRSLAEVVSLSGSRGLFVTIDDLDSLLVQDPGRVIRYTKVKREDTYESIRQLLDDVDSMIRIMIVFALDRVLLDDEKSGLKSYQALWMRVQNEVTGQRFNRFADIVDLDRYAAQEYDAEKLMRISEDIAAGESQLRTLNRAQAEEILAASKVGATGMPGLVRQAMGAGTGGDTHV